MINKKKRKKVNKLPIILISISLIIAFYFFNNYNFLNDIKITFKDIGSNIKKIFTIKLDDISDEIIIGIDSELLEENIELKKLLELDTNNFEFITCNIINRDIAWYNTLTLDKGKKDNITTNLAVISSKGLIGRIVEVGDNYSIVELITNKDFNKIAIDIKGIENNHAILDSYDGENLIIKNINKNSNISIGDKAYTNGLGGIYPAGIYIGQVIDIKSDELELAKELKVKPDTIYDNMRYVTVIRR